jgi:hypothetical protein
MIIDALTDAQEELKRSDHLFYVSLKYTRTVDVIKSLIERLINATGFCLDALLLHAKAEGIIEEVPKLPKLKADGVIAAFPEEEFIKECSDFYLFLRKISKAEFTRSNEFRRHVTMTIEYKGEPLGIKIDHVKEYYDKVQEFFNFCEKFITGVEED